MRLVAIGSSANGRDQMLGTLLGQSYAVTWLHPGLAEKHRNGWLHALGSGASCVRSREELFAKPQSTSAEALGGPGREYSAGAGHQSRRVVSLKFEKFCKQVNDFAKNPRICFQINRLNALHVAVRELLKPPGGFWRAHPRQAPDNTRNEVSYGKQPLRRHLGQGTGN